MTTQPSPGRTADALASGRPKILFLSQSLPYPPHSGVTSRTYNILKQLAVEFEVFLVPYFRRNHHPTVGARREAVASLRQLGISVAEPSAIPSEFSLGRKIWDHLQSTVSRRPYTHYEYASASFDHQLRDTLSRCRPDLVHLDSLGDLSRWIGSLPPVPRAATHHNIESQLLRIRADKVHGVGLRQYIRSQANLLEALERRVAPRVDVNVMVSALDAQRLKEMAPGARTVVIPNGVDTDWFVPDPTAPVKHGTLVFLGPTYMFPNRDGLEFFLAEAWPEVLGKYPEAEVLVVGKCREGDRQHFEGFPRVRCLGYVPDVRPYLASAACSIVPLRVGGGTRLKILDAWAMGRPVVSTTLGAEGLQTTNGENILLADDPKAFAEAVLKVLGTPALARSLGEAARETAVGSYGWSRLGSKLREVYRSLVTNRHKAW